MQALRIANYKVIKGTFPELAEEAKGGMLDTFKTQPGFIRYGLADTGDSTCVSISLWETRAQADAATPVAATWVREHCGLAELRSNRSATSPSTKARPQPFDDRNLGREAPDGLPFPS
jgi:hypothetical protein